MILQAEDTHKLIEQPFGMSDGLLLVDMTKPTKEDLEDLPRVWVTNGDEPWDPTIVDRKDISPIPSCYQPGDRIHFDVNSASKDVQAVSYTHLTLPTIA